MRDYRFPEVLKILRKTHKLTQKEVASNLSVCQQLVMAWEKGSRRPTIDGFMAIAEFFGVSIDYLVYGE